MKKYLWVFLVVVALGFLKIPEACADDVIYVPRARLEFRPELQLVSFSNNAGSLQNAFDLNFHLGLNWLGWRYVSIHGLLYVGMLIHVEGEFRNRYHNKEESQKVLPLMGVEAIVDVHTMKRILSFECALRVQGALAAHRVGIFTSEVGLGLGALPWYVPQDAILKGTRFGVMIWFPIRDDFHRVFDLDRKRFTMSMSVSFEW